MASRAQTPGSAFAKALRSFQMGGVTYDDFLEQIDVQLAAGASPTALLEILRRRESVEPLPEYARPAIIERLQSAPEPAGIPPESSEFSSSDLLRDFPPTASSATVEGSGKADATLPGAGPDVAPVPPVVNAARRVRGADTLDPFAAPAASPERPATEAALPEQPPPPPMKVGDIIGKRYHLVELLGEGANSRVYKAIDGQRDVGSTAPYVAIKLFTRSIGDGSDAFGELQNDVATLRGLDHPNIGHIYGCDSHNGNAFLIQEYVAGESLQALLRGSAAAQPAGGLAPSDAHTLIDTVAVALEYAHAHGVVHGDLKPGNVLLTLERRAKVIDFGLARWHNRPKTASERREAAMVKLAAGATPRYASPQLMARQRPETADDIYALACIAYELCTGSHPFDDGSGTQTMRFPPPQHPGLTATQHAALVRGLQFERRGRQRSVAEFMAEFNAVAAARSARKPLLWGAAALLLLAVGGFLLFSRAPRAPQPAPVITPDVPATADVPPAAVPAPAPVSETATGAKLGETFRDCPACPAMTVLPAGRFKQGSGADESGTLPSERPQHLVNIGHAFAMASNDVTVGDFRDFVAATKREVRGCEIYDGEWHNRPKASWKDPGFAQNPHHPVTCVSWKDAVAYTHWLSAKSGHQYRLPSASEWEYAARSGGTVARPWDSSAEGACALANVADKSAGRRYPGWDVFACDDGYANTAPVGSFKANAFGLNDIFGNVFEWTQDCWHDSYNGAPSDGSARMDGDCKEHELRGGSWFSSPAYVRASYRNHFASDHRTSSVGFRVVREIIP